jgi:hypothetical protein
MSNEAAWWKDIDPAKAASNSDGSAGRIRSAANRAMNLWSHSAASITGWCTPTGTACRWPPGNLAAPQQTASILRRRRHYRATGEAPSAAAPNAALNLLEARAQFEGPQRMVHVRIAEHQGRIYLDLADAAWRAAEIGPEGWRIVAEPPVRFRRSPGMLPLPTPQQGGSLEQLTSLLNLPARDDLVLVTTWLWLRCAPSGPIPSW